MIRGVHRRHLPPDDLHVLEPRSSRSHEAPPRDRGPVSALSRLRVAEVDEVVLRERGVERDVEEPSLPARVDARKTTERLRERPVGADDAHPTGTFGDELRPVRQERHRPRVHEAACDDAHVERDVRRVRRCARLPRERRVLVHSVGRALLDGRSRRSRIRLRRRIAGRRGRARCRRRIGRCRIAGKPRQRHGFGVGRRRRFLASTRRGREPDRNDEDEERAQPDRFAHAARVARPRPRRPAFGCARFRNEGDAGLARSRFRRAQKTPDTESTPPPSIVGTNDGVKRSSVARSFVRSPVTSLPLRKCSSLGIT